jgi:glycosyltransferase involved in cell wall biosynthesis
MILFWRQKKIIALHGGSFVRKLQHPLMRVYVRSLFLFMDFIISDNIHQQEALIQLGISPGKLHVIPAFIASPVNLKLLPTELPFLTSGKIRVITSGSLTPIYGYDTLIECISAFADTHEFIFTFYHTADPNYQQHVMARLKPFSNVQIFWNLTPGAFMAVLSTATVYVRATLSDGDSVTIREAILLKKVVFASDAVVRPPGCYLFETGNAQRLHALFSQHLLGELPQHEATEANLNTLQDIQSLYQTLLRER